MLWTIVIGAILVFAKFVSNTAKGVMFLNKISLFGTISNMWYLYPAGFALIVWGLSKNMMWAILTFIVSAALILISGGLLR